MSWELIGVYAHSSKLHNFLFPSKMFDIGDLPVPSFGNRLLKAE